MHAIRQADYGYGGAANQFFRLNSVMLRRRFVIGVSLLAPPAARHVGSPGSLTAKVVFVCEASSHGDFRGLPSGPPDGNAWKR
jgi:hypothetical protein